MRMLIRAARLLLTSAAICLLAAACSRGIPPSPGHLRDEPTPAAPELPSPADVRLPSETQSEFLKSAFEFEADLPFSNIGLHGDLLRFIPSKSEPLAYALYWLRAPDFPTAPTVQFDPGFDEEQAWLGIANFSTNRWDFGRAGELQYDSEHVSDGFILAAVVAEEYDELEWLIAGGLVPPFVQRVSPRAFSAGSSSDFHVTFSGDPAATYNWQFGGGLSISQSSQANPKFMVTTVGEYSGILTVANPAGVTEYEFSYSIVPASEYEPLHLYAIPSKTTVKAGEAFRVSVHTGMIPQSEAALNARVTLLFPTELSYVANSFNTGSPGGAKWDIDGFWALQPSDDAFFLTYPDSWLEEVPGPDSGMHYMEISLAAANLSAQYGSDALCNLELRCDVPGTYSLGFLERTSVVVTSFTTDEGEVLWHDISNDGVPSITVLP